MSPPYSSRTTRQINPANAEVNQGLEMVGLKFCNLLEIPFRYEDRVLVFRHVHEGLEGKGGKTPQTLDIVGGHSIDIGEFLFREHFINEWFHVAGVAYDRERAILYIFEPLADGARPLVHVFQV
jgi:hypothetical protein